MRITLQNLGLAFIIIVLGFATVASGYACWQQSKATAGIIDKLN